MANGNSVRIRLILFGVFLLGWCWFFFGRESVSIDYGSFVAGVILMIVGVATVLVVRSLSRVAILRPLYALHGRRDAVGLCFRLTLHAAYLTVGTILGMKLFCLFEGPTCQGIAPPPSLFWIIPLFLFWPFFEEIRDYVKQRKGRNLSERALS